jgi:ubiquinol-cytochrome c reductase cytochrome b subunit
VVFGAAVTATIVLLALIVGPPDLGPPPDPSILEAYPRPDWYFMWYFALLALAPNNLESAIIVLGPLVFGAALLLVPLFNKGHRTMRRRPWAPLLVVFIWTTIAIFWIAGERADWSPDFGAQPLPASVVGDQRPEVAEGARLFHNKGCEFCHQIGGYGGRRGPDLSDVASRMKPDEITARITNGGPNMPAYVRTLTPAQIRALTAFLSTRKP